MYRSELSIMAHNDSICRQAENAINRMIDAVKENGGQIWIQSKSNKEHYYELTEHISLNFFMMTSDDSFRAKISDISDSSEEG